MPTLAPRKKPVKFERLSRKQQRIAIAKDVLKQIRAHRVKAETMTYCRPYDNNNGTGYILNNVKCGTELQTVFKEKVTECTCCAKGALFLSSVELYNKISVTPTMKAKTYLGSSFENNRMVKHMRAYFDLNQINLIEYAFERGEHVNGGENSAETKYKAAAFGRKYPDGEDEKCLIAIMKNIIKNDGTFKP
jgi:hypothetical protein